MAKKKKTGTSEDIALVREMQQALPDMLAEMERIVADIGKTGTSLKDIFAEIEKYDPSSNTGSPRQVEPKRKAVPKP